MQEKSKIRMCKYYKAVDENVGNYFNCLSPGNHTGKQYAFYASGADGRRFLRCRSANQSGQQLDCDFFVESDPGISVQSLDQPKADQEKPSESNLSQQYTFLPEKDIKGMCKFWERDNLEGRQYRCLSPGNQYGPDEKFASTGGAPSVDRYRKHCRRADDAGQSPKCEYYPGV